MTYDEARRAVAALVCRPLPDREGDDEFVVLDEFTIEREWGWVFFYTSRKWHETKDFRYAIAGNAPIIVEKSSGTLFPTGTACSVDHYIANFERTGDPHDQGVPIVVIDGWRVGAQKVRATMALRELAAMSLSKAKSAVDCCLAGELISVPVASAEEGDRLVASLDSLGFTARREYVATVG